MEKRYEYQIFEREKQKKWQDEQIYSIEHNPGPLYSIDTPPPTVSGSLHIGHVFSYTQTDIIARYKRMNGFSVFYPFGFDDNGLATERYVEKKCKVKPHEMGRTAFINLCLEESAKAAESFKDLWQKLGLSVDWSKLYSTISPDSRKISQASFIELYKKGYIYRLQEPALYCTACRTSVAQAELDDIIMPSLFNDIIFKDEQGNELIIATTRPELLPACVAIFYHPDDERYQHLKNSHAIVPLFGHTVPILPDELVDMEKGTGLVMCCTFGDKTDIAWYKKHKLPFRSAIGRNGKMTDIAQEFAGLSVKDARHQILDKLTREHLVLRQNPVNHAVNVHERCKKEIEYTVLEQWFVKILEFKETFIKQAEHIAWFPPFMQSRYKNWVENLSWDWCISRQRFYGIPFPVWHCISCRELVFASYDELPIDPQEIDVSDRACPQCGEKKLVPDTDVMDTWNTSSLTPYIVAELYKPTMGNPFVNQHPFLPMSMRPQAHDIIRTWAFYTIVKTWMHNNTIPWNSIVISGHVLSDAQEKLSKSKENSLLSPENLLNAYSADAIRYWTATGSLGQDMAFSENQLKIGTKLITKLWNAFKFTRDHIESLDHPENIPHQFGLVNEWLLHHITQTYKKFHLYLEKNEFGIALQQVEQFFWSEFCDNYLELIKHQLFNPQDYDPDTIYATRWTLYHVGLRILQLFAPYMPYITETLYELLYERTIHIPSIHQTHFSNIQVAYDFEKNAQMMQYIIEIVTNIRKLKSEHQLSLKVPLATLTIYTTNLDLASLLEKEMQLIAGVSQAQEIFIKTQEIKHSEFKEIDGFWHGKILVE